MRIRVCMYVCVFIRTLYFTPLYKLKLCSATAILVHLMRHDGVDLIRCLWEEHNGRILIESKCDFYSH